ncbi:hypothetical protein AC249_AIPGENE7553 [Exaiptasia diaphana]|nr:hypothetical protein AC249_AIPGENE7553 [Exaiptasia diaphana]
MYCSYVFCTVSCVFELRRPALCVLQFFDSSSFKKFSLKDNLLAIRLLAKPMNQQILDGLSELYDRLKKLSMDTKDLSNG